MKYEIGNERRATKLLRKAIEAERFWTPTFA
jgi:hypothetical protein